MSTTGITAGEAERVVRDIFERRGVSSGLYSFKKRQLNVLVGSHRVSIPLPAGLGYYELRNITERVERIIADIEKAKRHVGQIDLEEAIAAAPA